MSSDEKNSKRIIKDINLNSFFGHRYADSTDTSNEKSNLNLNNIVKIEKIPEEKLNHYLTRGWRIQQQVNQDKYMVGLPLERAYQHLLEISRYFLHQEAIEHEFKRRAKLYGKDFSDYEQALREKIEGLAQDDTEYTHTIEKDDLFNQDINEFFALIKPHQKYLFAKPIKKDTPAK